MITRLVLIDWRYTLRGKPLTADEREQISRGIAEGLSGRAIARLLCRDPSVVSREIDRNGGRGGYRAHEAQERAEELTARPKVHKLVASRRLHEEVNAGLAKDWSPEQISARLEVDPAPRGALLYSQLSWEEFGGTFLDLMAYLNPKGHSGTIA
jgi:IS30 family transposase